jgi:hypothetical protein
MLETGPVYRLAAGPRNFVIIGEPQAAKHVLRNYGTRYHKGLVAEVSEFLFGSGFAIAEAELWQVKDNLDCVSIFVLAGGCTECRVGKHLRLRQYSGSATELSP